MALLALWMHASASRFVFASVVVYGVSLWDRLGWGTCLGSRVGVLGGRGGRGRGRGVYLTGWGQWVMDGFFWDRLGKIGMSVGGRDVSEGRVWSQGGVCRVWCGWSANCGV